MKSRIVMDSSCNLQVFEGVEYACVPLKIMAGDREFVDDQNMDVEEMVHFLKSYKGKASTACPGVGEYLEAFGEAEDIYCITITSNLSGSYNAARVAASTYLEKHPNRRVHVFDSLSTGAEMVLMAEKIRHLIAEKIAFDVIVQKIKHYQEKTRLMFCLESLHNLANNGRVSAAVATMAGILGIRALGKASDVGTLEMVGKVRGEKKLIPELVRHFRELGYSGGKMIIDHCCNLAAASKLKEMLLNLFPTAEIRIGRTGGLCSFYAEEGGMIIGFEVE